jgi:hypothetical protein
MEETARKCMEMMDVVMGEARLAADVMVYLAPGDASKIKGFRRFQAMHGELAAAYERGQFATVVQRAQPFLEARARRNARA